MGRWSEQENIALEAMKILIQSDIEKAPHYPEIVGDRRLIRFLRGYSLHPDKAAKAYLNFLKWRKDNDVDTIRNDILYNGKNHPKLFPYGEQNLQYMPQIIIAPYAFDNAGQPITLENYNFDPNLVLDHISIDQYIQFLIYSLEFRTLILEQFSEDRERKYLEEYPTAIDQKDGYGVVLKLCTLRDVKGKKI